MTPAIRRQRLQLVLDARFEGAQARLASAASLSPGRVSQLFDPNQPFGEKAARSLELAIGLRKGFLDEAGAASADADYPAYLSAEQTKVLRLWTPLFRRQKDRILKILEQEHAEAEQLRSEAAEGRPEAVAERRDR